MTQRARRRSSRLPWTWFASAAAGGVPVGLLWWLLAPGGLNLITRDASLAAGTNPAVWLPRDLTLAGLCVFAGCLVGVFLVDKARGNPRLGLLFGLAGGLVGALLAWQTGVLAGQAWGAPADTSANESIAFSLRSFAVILLWPAATASAVFAVSLLNLLNARPEAKNDGDSGSPLSREARPLTRKMVR